MSAKTEASDSPQVSDNSAALTADLKSFVSLCDRQHRTNWWQNYLVGGLALLSSASVVIAGLYDQGRLGAIFGVVTGLLLAFERFDPSGEKAQFYRELRTQGERLSMDLRDSARPGGTIRAEFIVLRENAARQIPRQGLGDAVKQLSEGLAKARASSP